MITFIRVILLLSWFGLAHHALKSYTRNWKMFAIYMVLIVSVTYALAMASKL